MTNGEEKQTAATGSAGSGGNGIARKMPAVTLAGWIFLAVVALSTAGLDLWSKAWATRRLSLPNPRAGALCTPTPGNISGYQRYASGSITLVHGYLDFGYAENCGGAFGLLHGASERVRRPFFFLVTIGAVLFIIQLYRSLERNQHAMRVALPLVLGGAIGNLIDRMRIGYVVDFIDAHVRDRYHWPTFNVADIAITVGLGLMVFEFIFGERKVPKGAGAKPDAAVT